MANATDTLRSHEEKIEGISKSLSFTKRDLHTEAHVFRAEGDPERAEHAAELAKDLQRLSDSAAAGTFSTPHTFAHEIVRTLSEHGRLDIVADVIYDLA